MEFRDTSRTRRRLLLLLGIVLAFVAGIGALTIARQGNQEAPKMRDVVTAAVDIPSRKVIAASDLTVSHLPDLPSLVTAFTTADQLVGQVSAVPITSGQIVYPSLLVATAAGANFSILSPGETVTDASPYWRAVAVMVPKERAVGGELLIGQHVDLFVGVQIDVYAPNDEGKYEKVTTTDKYASGRSTKITFQDLEVLDVNADDDIYVLKVDLHQAEEISHLVMNSAPFSIALRPDTDTRAPDTTQYGVTDDRLITHYLYPVPAFLDLDALSRMSLGGSSSPAPTESASPLPSQPLASPGPGEPSSPPGASAAPTP